MTTNSDDISRSIAALSHRLEDPDLDVTNIDRIVTLIERLTVAKSRLEGSTTLDISRENYRSAKHRRDMEREAK